MGGKRWRERHLDVVGLRFPGMAAGLSEGGLPPQAATAEALVEFATIYGLFDTLMSMVAGPKKTFPIAKACDGGGRGQFSHQESASGKPTLRSRGPRQRFWGSFRSERYEESGAR